MFKKTMIAAATAVALTGAAVATSTPAAAAPAATIEVAWGGPGFNHGGYKHRSPRRACEPIIRWKKVGYRYHRRWQPVVVGWNCHRGYHKGHKRWH
jgi:hypothetical protein